MSKEKTILLHAREAGVATMIRILIPVFESHGCRLVFDVGDYATDVLGRKTCLSSEEIDLIVCGYDDPTKDCTGALLKKNNGTLPTLGLLDSWKGVDRFWYQNGGLRPLTDRLIVPDLEVKNYLIKQRFPESRLIVAGHPVLENYYNYPKNRRKKLRFKTKQHLKISNDKPVLMVLSEPLQMKTNPSFSLLKTRVKSGDYLEHWLNVKYSDKFQLGVRFHPLEKKVVPSKWLDLTNLDLDSALSLADCVVGLASTTMAFSVAFGLEVNCLDREIIDWQPENSNIPACLWKKLISNGIFQNDPNRIEKKIDQPIQSGTLTIVNESKILINT